MRTSGKYPAWGESDFSDPDGHPPVRAAIAQRCSGTQCVISGLTYTTTGSDTDTQHQTEVRVMSTAENVGVAGANLMSTWSTTKEISHRK